MQNERYIAELRRAAHEIGQQHAENAASWIGPTNQTSAREILSKLEDGDPAVWDILPARPNLSGEYADELTPFRLACQIVPADRACWPSLVDEIADAYEAGVDDAFENAIVAELRKWAKGGE